jgi:hypothetical protein
MLKAFKKFLFISYQLPELRAPRETDGTADPACKASSTIRLIITFLPSTMFPIFALSSGNFLSAENENLPWIFSWQPQNRHYTPKFVGNVIWPYRPQIRHRF